MEACMVRMRGHRNLYALYLLSLYEPKEIALGDWLSRPILSISSHQILFQIRYPGSMLSKSSCANWNNLTVLPASRFQHLAFKLEVSSLTAFSYVRAIGAKSNIASAERIWYHGGPILVLPFAHPFKGAALNPQNVLPSKGSSTLSYTVPWLIPCFTCRTGIGEKFPDLESVWQGQVTTAPSLCTTRNTKYPIGWRVKAFAIRFSMLFATYLVKLRSKLTAVLLDSMKSGV